MKVSKWGNSLGVRIPKSVADALDLKEGDEVDVLVADPRTLELLRTPDPETVLKRLRLFRGLLPKDFHFDRFEANER